MSEVIQMSKNELELFVQKSVNDALEKNNEMWRKKLKNDINIQISIAIKKRDLEIGQQLKYGYNIII
jgi:hypothetical protein